MVKIGINGFGRIGRLILRALLENYKDKIQVVGINDLGSIETNAHLIKYDSTHGILPHDVKTSKDGFNILNQNIKVFAERDPVNLPWGKIGADKSGSKKSDCISSCKRRRFYYCSRG